MSSHPVAIFAAEAAERARKSIYPEQFAARVGGRVKRPLGDLFGLTVFGVSPLIAAAVALATAELELQVAGANAVEVY